jgi:nitroreductase
MENADFISLIISRRSIRDFKKKAVSEKKLLRLIEAASYAPSGGNGQPWFFHIISNQAVIKKLREAARKSNPKSEMAKIYGTLFNAPCIIAVSIDMGKKWYHKSDPLKPKNPDDIFDNPDYASVSAAVQNILLAAHSLKIGSCWCKISASSREKMEEILKIKPPLRLFANIAIGYYDKPPGTPQRKKIKDICKFVD